MIATVSTSQTSSCNNTSAACWHPAFLKMLPAIERHARIVFRHLKGDDRDEATQESICNACLAFARLVELDRADAASWSSLARYAVAQYRDGRRVGTSLNIKDVCSVHCQRRKSVTVQQLNQWDREEREWQEILVEDKHVTPADLATSRIDFAAFLKTLSRRDRRLAEKLATGESTSRAAKLFGISSGRISQLRQELKLAWEQFHEPATALVPA